MSILYKNLDANVRDAMCLELERDLKNETLYISSRLADEGVRQWPGILYEAFRHHDDDWVARTLRERGLMNATEQRRKPKGGFTTAQVPVTAPDTLAEGEFNRFYARGLCLSVIASGETEVVVYRGKNAQSPRPESQAMLGRRLPAQDLLDDLRTAQGVEPALGLPPGPNSGLTVSRV